MDRAGKWKQRGLIYEKELKIPEFPGEKQGVEAFRLWLRDFGRYIERHVDYPSAEVLARAIKSRDQDDPLIEDEDIQN